MTVVQNLCLIEFPQGLCFPSLGSIIPGGVNLLINNRVPFDFDHGQRVLLTHDMHRAYYE